MTRSEHTANLQLAETAEFHRQTRENQLRAKLRRQAAWRKARYTRKQSLLSRIFS